MTQTLPPKFDRASHRRTEPDYLERIQKLSTTRLVIVWRGKNLLDRNHPRRPVLLSAAESPSLLARAEQIAFLGESDGDAVLMVDLPRDQEPSGLDGTFELLPFGGIDLSPEDFQLCGYARAIAQFHRTERYDGRRAAPTAAADAGFARLIEGTEDKVFPRVDPAVMILITRGDACLLARQPRFPPGMYSALAGFVEPGESLEECVYRESLEEVGLCIEAPRYVGSQPWPFPRSLMIGFEATAPSGDIALDQQELEHARWFKRTELLRPEGFFFPPPYSLAHRLITEWANRSE